MRLARPGAGGSVAIPLIEFLRGGVQIWGDWAGKENTVHGTTFNGELAAPLRVSVPKEDRRGSSIVSTWLSGMTFPRMSMLRLDGGNNVVKALA